ncbi:hypothetical protein DAPPUDRAFT_304587 [Daphnia pulex]|uniref:Uncharacterized protein n=1 Tax=Daphnia pulex TaxID=6669 RepID=E9FVJ8_DAPPU|nr:hypothetical protein DAPPUDRAFT_304587 [Daphnia pulex]|eukprot:EFX88567.1 hypothetical protein DAPPUDRAFT_304587 [Daphnia pulex]
MASALSLYRFLQRVDSCFSLFHSAKLSNILIRERRRGIEMPAYYSPCSRVNLCHTHKGESRASPCSSSSSSSSIAVCAISSRSSFSFRPASQFMSITFRIGDLHIYICPPFSSSSLPYL